MLDSLYGNLLGALLRTLDDLVDALPRRQVPMQVRVPHEKKMTSLQSRRQVRQPATEPRGHRKREVHSLAFPTFGIPGRAGQLRHSLVKSIPGSAQVHRKLNSSRGFFTLGML